jgi:hypothetical protein
LICDSSVSTLSEECVMLPSGQLCRSNAGWTSVFEGTRHPCCHPKHGSTASELARIDGDVPHMYVHDLSIVAPCPTMHTSLLVAFHCKATMCRHRHAKRWRARRVHKKSMCTWIQLRSECWLTVVHTVHWRAGVNGRSSSMLRMFLLPICLIRALIWMVASQVLCLPLCHSASHVKLERAP